jgi:hypothetical protein
LMSPDKQAFFSFPSGKLVPASHFTS